MRLVFDIETDNFLTSLTKIHCICVRDLDNIGRTWSFGPDEIEAGLELLQQADLLCGHNILVFDIPAIKKIYPQFRTDGIVLRDTLVLSRLIHADLKNEDLSKAQEHLPKKLIGSHSLEAWGYRLGYKKGDFGKNEDWSQFSAEMLEYCLQDTLVTHRLWAALAPEKWSQESIEFEHGIAELCGRIGDAGWTFKTEEAGKFYAKLSDELAELKTELRDLFPPWIVETEFIPKVNNAKLGYRKGEPFIKQHEVVFNPNSRKHIQHCLMSKYDWKPVEFTQSGDAKIDENVLSKLPYVEAQKLARSFMLQKRIGQLAEGNAAWLRLVNSDGKLRHVINPNGTVTGRASSFAPNLQQVPSLRAEYGKECRELFTVPLGYQLVGADLSSLELRCLAHYLNDGGVYAKEVCEGDVHTANMKAAGLDTRDQAKTFIYALLYGAGDAKIGSIVGKGAKEGRQLRSQFMEALPAFAELMKAVKTTLKARGYLLGLDGRRLSIRSEHAALNTLLQSAGALICKRWIQLCDQSFKEMQTETDATIIAFVHDEIQCQVRGDPDHVGRVIRRMAQETQNSFNLRVPIEAEYKVGRTWADTH